MNRQGVIYRALLIITGSLVLGLGAVYAILELDPVEQRLAALMVDRLPQQVAWEEVELRPGLPPLLVASGVRATGGGLPWPLHAARLIVQPGWRHLLGRVSPPGSVSGSRVSVGRMVVDSLHAERSHGGAFQLRGNGTAWNETFELEGVLSASGPKSWRLGDIALQRGESDLGGALELDLSVSPSRLTGELVSEQLVVAALDNMEFKPGEPAPAVALPTAWPGLVDADVQVTFERINQYLGPLETRLRVNGNRARLSPLTLTFTGGSFNGEADLRVDGKRARLSLSGTVAGLDLAGVAGDALDGRMDVGLDLRGSGADSREWLASSNGSISLAVQNGVVERELLDALVLDLGELLDPWSSEPGRTRIRCMAGQIAVAGGVLETEQMVLDTEELLVVAQGSVDLVGGELDLLLQPDTGLLDLLELQAPVRISGTISEPSAAPAPRAAIQAGATAVLGALLGPAGVLASLVELDPGSTGCGKTASEHRS